MVAAQGRRSGIIPAKKDNGSKYALAKGLPKIPKQQVRFIKDFVWGCVLQEKETTTFQLSE